jgi:phenylacetate-CoA ligase
LDEDLVAPLPFVYLFGRADFTVSYFGANVYPENISVGLEQPDVRNWVSGKFVLHVVENTERDKELHVIVETSPGVEPAANLAEAIAASIHSQMLRLNSEFANYVPAAHQTPRITLRPSGDPEFFPVGVKHRYTKK